MIDSSRDSTTPFDGETPRRDAVRTIGVGAALLGLAGLHAAAARGKKRSVGAENRKRKCKKCPLIGLDSAESEPFSLDAGEGATRKATCPAGFIALSGGLQAADGEVTAPCMIRESHTEPDGSAWVVNVFCTEATNTELVVGAICFSLSSFQPQGKSGFRPQRKKG